MSAVAARMLSMISCAGGRVSPVGELELDDADGVLAELARAARLFADAGVDGLEARDAEHVLLGLGEEAVLFVEREVAAGVHDDLAVVGLDRGEELDAAAELAVADLHHDQQQSGEPKRGAGTAQHELHRAHVRPVSRGSLVVRHWRDALPSNAPSVGVKNSATASDADSVAISVIGRYFMNSPTTPGQNSSGENAATRVAVAAITGPAMRLAASE